MFFHFTVKDDTIYSYALNESNEMIFTDSYIIDVNDIPNEVLESPSDYKYLNYDFVYCGFKQTQNKLNEINQEIYLLEQKLSESDYKVIKCYECSLVEKELPYDINELHNQRQEYRDRINELEEQISALKGGK